MQSNNKKTNKISLIYTLTVVMCLLFFSFFLNSCENSTEPETDIFFSEMEIHYTKAGGWINTSKLDIIGDGTANALEIAHGSRDTINSSSKFLNRSKKEILVKLFSSFSEYESYYAPNNYYTDGNHHRIIFIFEGIADTVSVYEPQNAKIPFSLSEIILVLEDIWMNTL